MVLNYIPVGCPCSEFGLRVLVWIFVSCYCLRFTSQFVAILEMVDSGAFHINTVLQCVSYQSLEKGMTSANTYGSDSYPVDRYIAVFGLREDCGSGWGVRGLMSLLISGTSAAHYSLPFLSSFFRSYPQCDYCPTRQPDDIFYSLSESTVKDWE